MIFSRIVLKNWRNFKTVDVELTERMFLAGPNASGKSNLLDVFRFLRDLAKPVGGLQNAVNSRGGVANLRSLVARRKPAVEIEVHLAEGVGQSALWKYAIGFKESARKSFPGAALTFERVWRNDKLLVDRPNEADLKDPIRLTQTHLEQINTNQSFREMADFFDSIFYLHLVPQLLRFPDAFSGPELPGDPFGRSFLDRLARIPDRTRKTRLAKIEKALRIVIPQLKQLMIKKDQQGIPHLAATFTHWHSQEITQEESQFSDGTLRLIALFWSLLADDSVLLIEEPEISLGAGIIQNLPGLIHRTQSRRKRQVLLSTHSAELLSNKSIGGEEVLLLTPTRTGTEVVTVSGLEDVRAMLEGGLSIADAALPLAEPANLEDLDLVE